MSDSSSVDNSNPVEENLFLAMLLGWLVPGLGHVYMKKWRRGLICGGAILLLFVLGLFLCRWTYASRADFPFYLSGKYGSGFVLILQPLLTAERPIDFSIHFHIFEIGILFISVAGLLNATTVLNLIDVKYNRSLGKELERAEKQKREDRSEAEAEADTETESGEIGAHTGETKEQQASSS